MKKSQNKMLYIGVAGAIGLGIAYYFYSKSKKEAATPPVVAPPGTAGYFGATIAQGRSYPTPGQVDARAFHAAGY